MFEQGRGRADVNVRNISLQLQGQTGGGELQSGGPEGKVLGQRLKDGEEVLDWTNILEIVPSTSRLCSAQQSCEVEKCFCDSPNFKKLCTR